MEDPRRTHMRTPFVKRHTPPGSGFSYFFPLSRAWRSLQSVACADVLSRVRGPPRVAAPNPYCGSVATGGARAENPGGILCGLAIMLCPQTVLCTGMAAPVCRASEGQARARGRTRPWVRLSPLMQEPEPGSQQRRGLWDLRPRRTLAFRDAVPQDIAYAGYRLLPRVSRETPGAPALLPDPWRHVSLLQALWRLSI